MNIIQHHKVVVLNADTGGEAGLGPHIAQRAAAVRGRACRSDGNAAVQVQRVVFVPASLDILQGIASIEIALVGSCYGQGMHQSIAVYRNGSGSKYPFGVHGYIALNGSTPGILSIAKMLFGISWHETH